MSNVVISNKNVEDQKVSSIEKSKVFLPFNVTKAQIDKLKTMLSKIDAVLSYDFDDLKIASLTSGNTRFGSTRNRQLPNSKFTLAKTYVVTMKKEIVNKVNAFYSKIVEPKKATPVFDIGKETNLQEALQEATTEIDLAALNSEVSKLKELPEETPIENYQQVLANNPNNTIVFGGELNARQELNSLPNAINAQEQPVNSEEMNMPKVKVLKKSPGNVLIIPVVIIWLALVLIGTIKLVTNILT